MPGDLLLTGGNIWMVARNLRSDPALGDIRFWGGEVGFILLLGFVALSGLLLYALGQTVAMPTLLAMHLGSVLAFFLLTPFSKMVHGFYRITAPVKEASVSRRGSS